ncbi:MAG: alkaline phosphatase family protein, partial [Defluviitaleaceae bacterium]|nr:alkaline phosphatase family protein [Defluviitaleaceae bacterium]
MRKLIFAAVAVFALAFAACGNANNDSYIGNRDFPSPEWVGIVWGEDSTLLIGVESAGSTIGEMYLEDTFEIENEIAVILASGEIHRTGNFAGARLVDDGDNFDLVLADGTTFVNIAGVIADPPDLSVTDVHDHALRLLQEGNRVMVIVLDGWGWHMRHYHAHHQPFLSSQPAQMAHTVFPPFTPVAMSSIFTGQTPDVHGVHDRATRTMSAPDVFEAAYELGFTSTRVQGGVNIVQTSVLSALIPNLGHVFDTDRGVFDAAMARINDSDLMFIHFNSVDDISHTYGPYSRQVSEAMALVDELVWDLVEAWDGIAIILADHGQHYLGAEGRLGD